MSLISMLKSVATTKAIGVLAIPAAVVVSGLLVWNGSTAAFSGTTTNDGNQWTAGTISLKNDRATALFASTGITPGYSETHCITVTSTANVPTTLKMYTANVTGTGSPTTLSQNLNIQVNKGSGSTDANCTGFTPAAGAADYTGTLDAFAATNNYANGVGAIPLPAGGAQQYKITVSLPSGAPNTLQGSTAAAKFIWEAQG